MFNYCVNINKKRLKNSIIIQKSMLLLKQIIKIYFIYTHNVLIPVEVSYIYKPTNSQDVMAGCEKTKF